MGAGTEASGDTRPSGLPCPVSVCGAAPRVSSGAAAAAPFSTHFSSGLFTWERVQGGLWRWTPGSTPGLEKLGSGLAQRRRVRCNRGGRRPGLPRPRRRQCRARPGTPARPCAPCGRGSCGWWWTRTPAARSCARRCREGRRGKPRSWARPASRTRPPRKSAPPSCRRPRARAGCTRPPTPARGDRGACSRG